MRDPIPPNKVVESEEQHLKLTSALIRQIHIYAHALEHMYMLLHIHEHIHTHTLHQTPSHKEIQILCCVLSIRYNVHCFPLFHRLEDCFPSEWLSRSSYPERLRLSFQYLCCYSRAVRVEETFAKSCAIHWLLPTSFLLWKISFKMHYIRLCCGILV